MARPKRIAVGGIVYHVLNRGNGRARIFEKASDYDAFESLMNESLMRVDVRLVCYCLMPNHWHMLVWPRENDDLSKFFQWLTLTHTMRWHTHHGSTGAGHLYQGRFKSFPVESDIHALTVGRYVEANALRADLVKRAEDWRWSSLWRRMHPTTAPSPMLLAQWPVEFPDHWLRLVNKPLPDGHMNNLRTSVLRGRPFGSPSWQSRTAKTLGLLSSLRDRGRPWPQRNKGV